MILCCGEALIDMIPTLQEQGSTTWVPYPGGAVFNTAIALGRLGVSAGLLTGLSSDGFGRMLREALTDARVDTALSVATDRKTALAFVHLEEGQAEYTFYDEESATRMLRASEIPTLPRDVSALFFGGISLASEPCATVLESLQDREGADRVTMLDPNVRPAFLSDETAYRDRIRRMMRRSDIVKVSDEDLVWLMPDTRTMAEKMRAVLELGPSIVVATRGSEGAMAISRLGADISVPARAVEVVDTVGAGDTFNAGFLAKLEELGLLTGDRIGSVESALLGDALEYGVAAAALAVSKAGAQPPLKEDLA